MESLDNLMDFDNAVRNISPNSKFMKPLITPVSTPLRVRTVSDPARLSLDNNPFDKALREIQLKTMEDDPFEKVLKESLNLSQDDTLIKELGNPTIVVTEGDLFCEKEGVRKISIASPSKFNIIPECIACSCKKENRKTIDTSCLCNMNISDCPANEHSDTFQSSGSSVSISTRSVLNRGVRYASSEMDKLNSTSDSQQFSIMDKGFLEEQECKSKSTSEVQTKDFMFAMPSSQSRSKSAQSSTKLIRENTFSLESPLCVCEEADLNASVFEEAAEVSVGLGSRESSVEDLLSVEPVWSDNLSDIDPAEKEQELLAMEKQKTPMENEEFLSNEATPEAKILLNDVKGLLESKEIEKKALDDVLCRVSLFCDNLKSLKENQITVKKEPLNKNINDVRDTKKTPSKLLLPSPSTNIAGLKIDRNSITRFLECLQESNSISDTKFVNELITSLRILQNDKLCNKKDASKLKTPKTMISRIRRSNSVDSHNIKQSPQSPKTVVKKEARPKKILNTDKNAAKDKASNEKVPNDKVDNKSVIQTKSLIPNVVKSKLRSIKLTQSASKVYKSSLTDDSKLELKTSTPNPALYYHNGAFVFSTPGKHET